jgi:hypothetical protein
MSQIGWKLTPTRAYLQQATRSYASFSSPVAGVPASSFIDPSIFSSYTDHEHPEGELHGRHPSKIYPCGARPIADMSLRLVADRCSLRSVTFPDNPPHCGPLAAARASNKIREHNSLTGLGLATIAAEQPALQFRIRRRVTQPDRDHGARKILALNDSLVRAFDRNVHSSFR